MKRSMLNGPFSVIAASCLAGDLITDSKNRWAVIVSNEVVDVSDSQRAIRIVALFYNGLFSVRPTSNVTVYKGVIK